VCYGGAGVVTSLSQSDKTGAVERMDLASEVVMRQVLQVDGVDALGEGLNGEKCV
jgi:hypothetical protein